MPVSEIVVELRLLRRFCVKVERRSVIGPPCQNRPDEAPICLVIAGVVEPGVCGLGDRVVERASYLLYAFGVHAG